MASTNRSLADDGGREKRTRKQRATTNPNIKNADGSIKPNLSKFDFPHGTEGFKAWCAYRIALAEWDMQNPPLDLNPEYRERIKKQNELKRLEEKLAAAKAELAALDEDKDEASG